MINDEGDDPGGYDLIEHDIKSLYSRVHFAPDGSQCRDTGRIEQGKGEEAERGQRGKDALQRCTWYIAVAAQQDRQCTDDYFFGSEAGDKRCCCPPVAETERCEEGGDKAADTGQHAVFWIIDHIEAAVKTLQQPDDDTGNEDDSKGFIQEVLGFAPHVQNDVTGRGQTVSWQFHNKGYGLAVINEGF